LPFSPLTLALSPLRGEGVLGALLLNTSMIAAP